jgi:hypothetical protein
VRFCLRLLAAVVRAFLFTLVNCSADLFCLHLVALTAVLVHFLQYPRRSGTIALYAIIVYL